MELLLFEGIRINKKLDAFWAYFNWHYILSVKSMPFLFGTGTILQSKIYTIPSQLSFFLGLP